MHKIVIGKFKSWTPLGRRGINGRISSAVHLKAVGCESVDSLYLPEGKVQLGPL